MERYAPMTIERSGKDNFVVCCDHCSESDEFYGDFMEVIEEIKDKGWKVSKDEKGEWDHSCPDCVEKENEELDEAI